MMGFYETLALAVAVLVVLIPADAALERYFRQLEAECESILESFRCPTCGKKDCGGCG